MLLSAYEFIKILLIGIALRKSEYWEQARQASDNRVCQKGRHHRLVKPSPEEELRKCGWHITYSMSSRRESSREMISCRRHWRFRASCDFRKEKKSDKRGDTVEYAGDSRGSNFRLLVTRCNKDKPGIFCYASNPRTNLTFIAHPNSVRSKKAMQLRDFFRPCHLKEKRVLWAVSFKRNRDYGGPEGIYDRTIPVLSFKINDAMDTEFTSGSTEGGKHGVSFLKIFTENVI